MKLSMLNKLPSDMKIIRDNDFESFGILDSETKLELLTFLDDDKYLDKVLYNNSITMVITTEKLKDKIPIDKGVAVSSNPRLSFFNLHNSLSEDKDYIRKNFKTKIGNGCDIHPLSNINSNNVKIGNNVTIEEFVSIKAGTIIGDNSIVRAGSVIGSSGFEFKRDGEKVLAVKHYGGVIIGENVEIKCNTVVDKAVYPWDDTIIGNYSKIDNLIHIAHACKIMNRVLIAANSAIGGRVKIHDNAWIGIGSAIRNGIEIGENSRVNMGAIATKNVPDNESVSGNFAIEHKRFIENIKKMG